jgi:uncharacterized protein with FMN-binding domain
VRKSAQVAASVLSLGVLALSYKAGIDQSALAAGSNGVSTAANIQTSSFVKNAATTGTTPTTPTPTATPATTKPVVKTATGTLVNYAFGQVQVKATKTNGKLTAITYVVDTASRSRMAAFPYLVQYAVQAGGANFGNLGGATYTTNAFKQSLTAALAKI